MTLYRNTSTGEIWTDDELIASIANEIDALDDEDSLKQEVDLHGDAAIREYIIECCLVGIYSRVDDGEDAAYNTHIDAIVKRAQAQACADAPRDVPSDSPQLPPARHLAVCWRPRHSQQHWRRRASAATCSRVPITTSSLVPYAERDRAVSVLRSLHS
jgi:hypothetical protein